MLLLLLVASVGEYHGVQLPGYWLFNTANIFAGGWGIEPHTALQQRPPDVIVCNVNVLVTNKHVYGNSQHASCNKNIPALIKLLGT